MPIAAAPIKKERKTGTAIGTAAIPAPIPAAMLSMDNAIPSEHASLAERSPP